MIDIDQIVEPGARGRGAAVLLGQVVAACDESIAEALSGVDHAQAIENVRRLGFTNTADQLQVRYQAGALACEVTALLLSLGTAKEDPCSTPSPS